MRPYGSTKFKSVDDYHSRFSDDVRKNLDALRKAIRSAAPKSEEVISYNMPAFRQGRILVYYAAAKEHIGFYPTANPISVFKNDLKKYKTSRGTIQFPQDKKIPVGLVKKIVKFRLNEITEKEKQKK